MKVSVKQIRRGPSSRSIMKPITGHATYPPRVGHRFEIVSGDALSGTGIRELSTTPVTHVLSDGRFKTQSGSVYQIKTLKTEWN